MTPTQRTAALRLADYFSEDGASDNAQEAAALLRELAQEPQGEPVAWCALTTNGRIAYFEGKPMVMPGPVGNEHHDTPIYAYPPQRQPLSDEQIDELVLQEQFLLICDGLEELTEIVRAVEQAHGITGETK